MRSKMPVSTPSHSEKAENGEESVTASVSSEDVKFEKQTM